MIWTSLWLLIVSLQIYNLETLLLQAPTQTVRGGESKNLSQLLSQKLKPTIETNPIIRWYQKTKYFVMDNWQRVWVMALWLAILAGLFTYKFVQYSNKEVFNIMGYCVCTAKGAAETLKFNMALILLPVCRNTITWLRNKTKLGVAVPFDDNINFHKVRNAVVIYQHLNPIFWGIMWFTFMYSFTGLITGDSNSNRCRRGATRRSSFNMWFSKAVACIRRGIWTNGEVLWWGTTR